MKNLKNKVMLYMFMYLISLSLICFFFFIMFLKYKLMFFLKWEILFINLNSFEMVFYFDWMSFSFMSIVFFISSMVSLYSMSYMSFKKNHFIYLIFMFVSSMIFLISSMNMASILIGWDGLGLVSYVLIIFFQSDKSKNSGMVTLMINRVGDILIIFSSWIFFHFSGLNFFFYFTDTNQMIMVLIILAAMTKSAQIPFSSWLPMAMAAPTPVSSLVHSSTLVTAGIYLMIRFNEFYYKNELLMKFILIMSSLTMILAGIFANYEMDLKKIIALSTLSQLGLMMMILSLNFYLLSFFHLLTHALFKALLFLCSGIMLHNLKNNQDIRYMGLMYMYLPYTFMCFNVANLSLCGFLFLSGFFSKDLIIEKYLMSENNLMILIILIISTMLTVSYTFRMTFFLSYKNMNSFMVLKMKEEKIFSMVLLFMTFFSIIMGSLYSWTNFMMFFEPVMDNLTKLCIPMMLVSGLVMSTFFINKNEYFSSMIFLNYTISDLKNISMNLTKKIFYVSHFGFFEFLGSQGMYNYMLYLSKLNSYYFMMNFKMLTFLSIILMMIYYL